MSAGGYLLRAILKKHARLRKNNAISYRIHAAATNNFQVYIAISSCLYYNNITDR